MSVSPYSLLFSESGVSSECEYSRHPRCRCRTVRLLSKTDLADERAVAIDVFAVEVVEQSATLTDQLQQPTPGAVVVYVLAQVLRQLGDPGCKECDLNF